MQTVMIAGDTFRHKDTLRALGGRWNATARVWEVPAAVAPKALALSGLYASGGASAPSQTFTRATASRRL